MAEKTKLDSVAQIVGIVAGAVSIITGIVLLKRQASPPSSPLSSSCSPCSLSSPPRRKSIRA